MVCFGDSRSMCIVPCGHFGLCPSCGDEGVFAGKKRPYSECPICREEPDGPGHVLLRCPALMALRFNRTGAISISMVEARRTEYVGAMGTAFRWLVGREASRR